MEPGLAPAKRPPKVDAGMLAAEDVRIVGYRPKADHPQFHFPDNC